MADVENQQDSSIPVKRKPDLYCQDQDNVSNKSQKRNPSLNSADSESNDGEFNCSGLENIRKKSSISPDKAVDSESEKDENGVAGGDLGAEEEKEEGGDVQEVENEEEEEEEEEEDEDDDDDDDDEEEEDVYLIEAETDRKGKGISREDKGKGKLIEDDESDDSDDEDIDEDDGSDLSDDPLAEVDLDNILPSRTRRRSIQPGVYISSQISDRGCNDDDDSSDDSDA